MDARARAEALIRNVRAISDTALRIGYLLDLLLRSPLPELAAALDVWCARAEQAEEAAREALVSLVDALAADAAQEALQRLREEAAGEALLALDRLVRHPGGASTKRPSAFPLDPNDARVPDYGKGRPLTLGERKSLARKPDRAAMERLLRDPHPDVIRRLLVNPRLTEDDVLRLVTKRPNRQDVLTQIARSPRWMHCARVRRALILNPDTPVEIGVGLVGLLMRQELKLVAESTTIASAIRARCREHLERRPPGERDEEPSDEILQ